MYRHRYFVLGFFSVAFLRSLGLDFGQALLGQFLILSVVVILDPDVR